MEFAKNDLLVATKTAFFIERNNGIFKLSKKKYYQLSRNMFS